MMLSNLVVRRLILLGTPLALAIWMLFHPWPYDDYLGQLVPIANWWIALHIVQFVLLAFMGVAVWLLTEGMSGIAATISKVAAVVFAISYDIGDAVAGISTAILARVAAEAPTGEQDAFVRAIGTLFRDPGKNLSFEIGIDAWVVALFLACASRLPLLLFAPAAYFPTFDHAFPFGSLAFGFFFLAALWLERAPWKRISVEREDSPSTCSPVPRAG